MKTCNTCIHLYDESVLTACMKDGRWVVVEYAQECDIDSWEGGFGSVKDQKQDDF